MVREWVQAEISRHIAAMQTAPMAGCPLSVDAVQAEVLSDGAGFVVRVQGRDAAAADEEILRRARSL